MDIDAPGGGQSNKISTIYRWSADAESTDDAERRLDRAFEILFEITLKTRDI
jgi:hypothetical protein